MDDAARLSGQAGMPPVLKALLGLGLGLLLTGAVYLVAVRGSALFLDLSHLSGMLFCI